MAHPSEQHKSGQRTSGQRDNGQRDSEQRSSGQANSEQRNSGQRSRWHIQVDNIQNTCTCLFINRLCMFMSGQFGLCLFMVVYDCLFVACSSVLTKQASQKTVFGPFRCLGSAPPFPGPKKCISARFCHLQFCLEKKLSVDMLMSGYVCLCLFMSVYVCHVCSCLCMSTYVCSCLVMSVYVCLRARWHIQVNNIQNKLCMSVYDPMMYVCLCLVILVYVCS